MAAEYDHDYYKTGAGKTALSLPTWSTFADLSAAEITSIKDDLATNNQTWPPTGTPTGG